LLPFGASLGGLAGSGFGAIALANVILQMCYALRVTRPEPKPCKRKYGRVPFEQMLRHIKQDKCEQCRAVVLYLIRESEIDR